MPAVVKVPRWLVASLLLYSLVIPNSRLCAEVAQGSDSIGDINRSLNRGLDVVDAMSTSIFRMQYKTVLFITNRRIDTSAEQIARRGGRVLALESLFLRTPAVAISYGSARISYPTNRRRGESSYGRSSTGQNPLYHFSIVALQIVNTPEAFRSLITQSYPNAAEDSLLYVHGLDNSFSEGAERLAQLALDLDIKGIPVFFSWPSDAGRVFPDIPRFGISEYWYHETAQISRASRPYVAHAMRELAGLEQRSFNLIAHSMGTELAVSAILLGQPRAGTSANPNISPRSLVLAAPDISTREFDATLRLPLTEAVGRVVVYCSDDHALRLSRQYNQLEERLGYCDTPKPPMGGIDMVRVRGRIRDFARHSYYLNSIMLLDDMAGLFATQANSSSWQPSPATGRMRDVVLP